MSAGERDVFTSTELYTSVPPVVDRDCCKFLPIIIIIIIIINSSSSSSSSNGVLISP